MQVILLLAILVAGCRELVGPPLPQGSVAFTAPPEYELWWNMTKACSGSSRELRDVEWYVVPDASEIDNDGVKVQGFWDPVNNRIVLAGRAQSDGSLVRHEMLHALIGRAHGDHPRAYFLERCAGVVVCNELCIGDAGPAPSSSVATSLSLDALEIDVQVVPAHPSRSTYDGHFAVIVTARNPAGYAIAAPLPIAHGNLPPVTFSLELEAGDGRRWFGERAWDQAATVFAPGETKRQVFDFVVAGRRGRGLAPDSYSLLGAYGQQQSTPRRLELVP